MKCISQQIYVVQIETRQLLEKPLSLCNGKYLHFLLTRYYEHVASLYIL